ncbi:hypothetical protein NHX12_033368 [Muraenolepis orangiensis]|uniref:Uncharacterized protein n=1 Tax=Muraenolepis orangiensis TaxID=630683 RepID=A0A9Q0E5V7_9TELE|nr:hypothetical protein NHX12_033368 [Muraenolepis orangiensis]
MAIKVILFVSTLNSASSVKKWIPSIKSEIEYYLQQSQLAHYPERKITEFQLCIQDLEIEYKRFVTKLRALDPTCKRQPWTPRAYSRKRADTQDSLPSTTIKKQRCGWLDDKLVSVSGVERVLASKIGSAKSLSNEGEDHISQSEAKPNPILEHPESACVDQDLPLSFNPTRLAMAVAGFRGPVTQSGASHTTQKLCWALQSGLPNLSGSLLGQSLRTPTTGATGVHETLSEFADRPAVIVNMATLGSGTETKERPLETLGGNGGQAEKTGHVLLGLSCYSSSDEESGT